MVRETYNLPAWASAFIGREAELVAVRSLVAGARLVTLTGAAGAGRPSWRWRRADTGCWKPSASTRP